MIKAKFRDINKYIAISAQYIDIDNITIYICCTYILGNIILPIYCLVDINIKIDVMFIPREARVVRLSQNSDDYKRQVRQLHANIQSLGNVLESDQTDRELIGQFLLEH